jgi:LemA protein
MALILAIIAALAILWFIFSFNQFIRQQNFLRESASGIDVQLKRRADLIPNLVEAVKGYASHERALFEEIANARSKVFSAQTTKEKSEAQTQLSQSVKSLIAVAENYPQLKANENFLALQKALAEIEDEIQMARRYYNGRVREFNILVSTFPSMLLARLFGFKEQEYFEIEYVTERQRLEIKL